MFKTLLEEPLTRGLERDRPQFELEFPVWKIRRIYPCMPFVYLLSGGVSMRSLSPGWSFGFWDWLETRLTPWMNYLAGFALIVLDRTESGPSSWVHRPV